MLICSKKLIPEPQMVAYAGRNSITNKRTDVMVVGREVITKQIR
jgi:hypothetical protein